MLSTKPYYVVQAILTFPFHVLYSSLAYELTCEYFVQQPLFLSTHLLSSLQPETYRPSLFKTNNAERLVK